MPLDDILQGLDEQKKRIEANLSKLQTKTLPITPVIDKDILKDIPSYQPQPKVQPNGKIESVGEVDKVESKFKVALTIPLLAVYLKRGVSKTEIARICNISPQAVDQ